LQVLDAAGLEAALRTIDELEPVPGAGERLYLGKALHPWLLGMALLLSLWQRWRAG